VSSQRLLHHVLKLNHSLPPPHHPSIRPWTLLPISSYFDASAKFRQCSPQLALVLPRCPLDYFLARRANPPSGDSNCLRIKAIEYAVSVDAAAVVSHSLRPTLARRMDNAQITWYSYCLSPSFASLRVGPFLCRHRR
jgi:hypothetical protein